jgi:NAD+ kinase
MKISTKHPEYASFEFKYKQHKHCIDYIVTIGGDGTILYAAKDFVEDVPPLISFQRGSLGFMCRFRQDEIVDVINKTVSSHLG